MRTTFKSLKAPVCLYDRESRHILSGLVPALKSAVKHDVSGENRDHGKFAVTAGSGKKESEPKKGFAAAQRVETGEKDKKGKAKTKWQITGGGDLPSHHNKPIPPAWSNVHVSLDPHSALQVTGVDEKGRKQSRYSDEHTASQKVKKFSKVRKLLDVHDKLGKTHEANHSHANSKTAEAAKVMSLIHAMGLRPGSENDTGAEKQAYGATTLQKSHLVKGEDGKLHLKFTGKKGVDLDLPVDNPKIAAMLEKQHAAAKGEKLFKVSDSDLRDYAHEHGGYNPKDYRTAKGTKTAREVVASMPVPKTAKEKKEAINHVGDVVSKKLGNTRTVALDAYIDPSVFAHWHVS